ncbi:MAG: flippase-like domain-containing protein, partial [Myxococcales bacterium]|nr:flippase-like domain-containing protein [Myxococcales bacterium]
MATAKPKIRSRWPLITKIAGLLLIVVFLVRNPEILLNAWRVLRGADPFYWATGLGLMVTSLWIAGWRTYYLLRLNGHRIAQSRLFVDILQATALNVVLIMGADVVYRAKRINDVVGNPAMAGTIVVFDRLIGFAVVLGGSIVAFAFFGDAGGGIRFNPKLLLLGVGALGLAILALRFLAPGRLRSLLRQVEPLLRHLTSPKHFLGLGAVSVAVFVTWVVSVGLLGKALGQTLGLGVYAYASSFV